MLQTMSSLKRLCIAAAGTLLFVLPESTQAISTGGLPSLKLQVHIKRDSATVLGVSDFDIIATPVVTTSVDGTSAVYYDAEAQFTSNNNSTSTYKVIDGVTYTITQSSGDANETVECSTSSVLPPVADLINAFNRASPIAAVSSSESIQCPRDKLYSTALLGEPYVICTSRASAPGFTIYGSNIDVDVTYLSASVEISKPKISGLQALMCTPSPSTTTLTDATASLLGGVSSNSSAPRRLESEATVTLAASSCSCKGKKRPCLFVHGLGRKDDTGLVDSFDYFGKDLASHAPCCSSIKYMSLNTVNNPWYSDAFQQRVCTLAMQVSPSSSTATKTISDTIIVTHSMGNLMLAGAISTGKCKLDASSTWVGTSGPMKGSLASDFNQNACAGNTNKLISGLADLIGRCPVNPSTTSLAYQNEKYASADLNAKYTAAQAVYTNHVSAVMCSNDNAGIFSTDQIIYKLAGAAIPHKSSQNDGIVEYQSCRAGIPESKFSNSYTSKFYVTKLNHMDTTFRHGDGLLDGSKMPVKWFECLL